MNTDEPIPEEQLWREDGHASDLAVSALADGQDALVPERVVTHVDTCAACTERLAEAAHLALAVDVALGEAALGHAPAFASPDSRRKPAAVSARFPLGAVALALVLAVFAQLPLLSGGPELLNTLGSLIDHLPRLAANVGVVGALVLKQAAPGLVYASLAAVLLMVFAGWLVAHGASDARMKGHLS